MGPGAGPSLKGVRKDGAGAAWFRTFSFSSLLRKAEETLMTDKALDQELLRFAQEHPQGWGHQEWLGLLAHLGAEGFDVSDPDGIGLGLEHHRLALVLRRMEIKGLGPRRIEALAYRFGTLWNLMTAPLDDVAQVPGVPRSLAEQVLDVLQ